MAEVINMPKLGFDMAEGTLVRWLKREGEPVHKGEVLAEIETDKATVEVEASVTGVIGKLLVAERTTVPVGTAIAVIGAPGEAIDLAALPAVPAGDASAPALSPTRLAAPPAIPAAAAPPPEAAETPGARLPGGVRASPLARRLAAERGVPLASLSGSGPGGRVLKRDVLTTAPAQTDLGAPRPTERVPLSRLRGAIGRRMAAAKQQVPHFYVTVDVDAAPLMALRSDLNRLLPEDAKLSVNDFIVRAAALTLREFPNLNASFEGDAVVRHGPVHIGVAVAMDEGLITVVVRDADQKPLRQAAAELRASIARARGGRVRPEEVEGSTFTVSNLGMFDVDHFIAIINPPEAAILAVGSVQAVPVVSGGQIVAGQRLKLTLSADHRVTDGAEAARSLQLLRAYLEQPLRLLI